MVATEVHESIDWRWDGQIRNRCVKETAGGRAFYTSMATIAETASVAPSAKLI